MTLIGESGKLMKLSLSVLDKECCRLIQTGNQPSDPPNPLNHSGSKEKTTIGSKPKPVLSKSNSEKTILNIA
jgi:hypothetical protein